MPKLRKRRTLDAKGTNTVLQGAHFLLQKAVSMLLRAEEDGDAKTALGAIREATRVLELTLRVLEQTEEGFEKHTSAQQEWSQLANRVVEVLAAFPEAREAVINALKQTEHK